LEALICDLKKSVEGSGAVRVGRRIGIKKENLNMAGCEEKLFLEGGPASPKKQVAHQI